jgi:hypothetical protein
MDPCRKQLIAHDASEGMFLLRIYDGLAPRVRSFDDNDVVQVGRDPSYLDDPLAIHSDLQTVSRKHGRIYMYDGMLCYEDTSANGSRIIRMDEERPIKKSAAYLNLTDVIWIGQQVGFGIEYLSHR